jgi:exonuclease III
MIIIWRPVMKMVSWNCQNGLTDVKANKIQETFPDADIFVIQECRHTDIYTFKENWKFKNWYGDDLEYSDLGIAVFSKDDNVEFTDTFNREFRYVVPYKVKSLTLLAVWTKPLPYYYDKNVTKAIQWYESKGLLTDNAIIIGDFNTGASKEHQEHYLNLCKNLKGYKNCTSGKPEELKETFCNNENKLYLNDFCFVSESLYSYIKEIKIHDEWEERRYGRSWYGLSDHCPIIVDLKVRE